MQWIDELDTEGNPVGFLESSEFLAYSGYSVFTFPKSPRS